MIKMPCLFVRDFHGHNSFTLTEEVAPGCEWVIEGAGTASRKRDGTACRFAEGQLWKRYDAKRDRKTMAYKPPPEGAVPCADPDPTTGHWPHWAPLGPHDYWHAEAFERQRAELVEGATYELCGPKLQGNPERLDAHTLVRHGVELVTPGRTFAELRSYLKEMPWEGIVFAHPDGRRYAKIRRADFGIAWPPTSVPVPNERARVRAERSESEAGVSISGPSEARARRESPTSVPACGPSEARARRES